MNIEAAIQAIAAVAAPTATVAGLLSRKRRLRAAIRENLALAGELEQSSVLREHTPVSVWMHGRIVLDVAKLAGQSLGTPKKPIPKGSVALASTFAILFGAWTYYIDRKGFVWYSVFPALAASVFVISILGMTTNRELPPSEQDNLPPGATPIRSESASEQIAASIALATEPGAGERFREWGQAGVVLRFVSLMREGRFEDAIGLADSNWLHCRVQSWLWNNRDTFGADTETLSIIAHSLSTTREPSELWNAFAATESGQFRKSWEPIDVDKLGVASRERRIAVNYALVILTPVGDTGGFFVNSATMLQEAMTFVVHSEGDRWLVASHLGTAPPAPGWPPAWWSVNDPAIQAPPARELPEDGEEESLADNPAN
ncbi:hypothetical protein [Micromonospora sp. NPDC049301]|uniref:hypothetical protein n=1 Tax=Micromonospora sp. NPDC049301 TaxID=3155723 RepID=UPI0034194A8F